MTTMMIIWTINILLLISLIISLIVSRNLFVQNTKYEEYIDDSFQQHFEILQSVKDDINDSLIHIRSIDERQMFEKDDDVGIIFTEIVNTVEQLDKKIELYGTTKQEN